MLRPYDKKLRRGRFARIGEQIISRPKDDRLIAHW